MSATFIALAATALLLLGAGVLAIALYGRLKLGQPWRLWWLGGGTFVASQVVHVPLLNGLGSLMKANEASGSALRLAVNVAILGLSAGLCEEIARYVALRWFSKGAATWGEGVMFGAGHGGVEAILLGAAGVTQSAALLAKGDQLLEEVRRSAPEQVEAVAETIRLLREAPVLTTVGGLWERGVAMALHIALALMVLRAVRSRRWGWLAAAIAVHAAVDSGAVALLRATHRNVLAVEGALTLVGLASLWWIRRERRAFPAPSVPASVGGG